MEQATERIGFWIDTDQAYFTLDNDYIESVCGPSVRSSTRGWRGGSPRSPTARATGPRSSHEVAVGYKDDIDPSVFVRASRSRARRACPLLGWTTTLTLLSNAVLAVHPDVEYARVRRGDEVLILALPPWSGSG